MSSHPAVEIALALIVRRGRVLVARRAHGPLAGLWEFPGGKIEPGETWEAAAERECREELDLAVRPVERLGTVEHAYPEFTVRLNLVLCASPGDAEPRALASDAVAWAPLAELGGWRMPVPNTEILRRLRAHPRAAAL